MTTSQTAISAAYSPLTIVARDPQCEAEMREGCGFLPTIRFSIVVEHTEAETGYDVRVCGAHEDEGRGIIENDLTTRFGSGIGYAITRTEIRVR